MKELKKNFVLLVLFILLVFTLEHIGYGEEKFIDFPTHFYFLLVLATLSSILVPQLRWLSLYNLLLFWGILFVAVSLAYFHLNGYEKLQILMLAFILLETSILIAYHLNIQISNSENLMESLAGYLYPNRTNNLNSSLESIHLEFSRSRRHYRPISVLVIEPEKISQDTGQIAYQALRQDLLQNFVDARIGQLIAEQARQTDLVMRDQDGKFVIVCAETNMESSAALARRVQNNVLENLNASLRWAIAEFPKEALTFEDLVQKAKEKIT
jgi:GGDEF domain-containing protein